MAWETRWSRQKKINKRDGKNIAHLIQRSKRDKRNDVRKLAQTKKQ